MSEAAVSAPAAAPAPSAPAASPAPVSNGAPPAAANAPAPPSGGQEAPPAVTRVPWKTKVPIGDAEHEVELDASPFLSEYKRKLKLDGEEVEVGVEDAMTAYERRKVSTKRFEEAAQARREAEAERNTITEHVKVIESRLRDPQQAPQVMRRALGAEYTKSVLADLRQAAEMGDRETIEGMAEIVASRLEYERLPPEQRQQRDRMTAAERAASDRERALEQRERAIKQQEARTKAEQEKRIDALAQERRKQLVAEWTPALEKAGVPQTPRMLRLLAQTLSDAKRNGVPMTLAEAVSDVREEYEQLVGHAVKSREQQQIEAAQQQPGRSEPTPPSAAPRAPNGRFQGPMTAEDFERQLRGTWQR